MMPLSLRLLLIVLASVLVAAPTLAQLRDPTVAPALASVDPASAPAAARARPDDTLGDLGLTVLVRDGKPYLASGTRLYAVGQKVGAYTIERIAETEVWLRSRNELRKIPRYNGIVRRASASERPTP